MHKNDETGPTASGRGASTAVGNAALSSQPYKRNGLKEISSFKGSVFFLKKKNICFDCVWVLVYTHEHKCPQKP